MTQQRKVGINAENAPNIETLTVQASDFGIAGIIGKFERNYESAVQLKSFDSFVERFGGAVYPSTYGYDCVKGFFDNIIGATGTLYIKGHVGYTGSAIDGVAANKTIQDQDAAPEDTLKITAAYKGGKDYGTAGNRTGFRVINGYRFTTATDGVGAGTDTWVVVDAVTGFRVGDIIEIKGAPDLYRKVTSIDAANRKVNFTPATSQAVPDASAVNILGFQVKTHRKNINGIDNELEKELGKVWCTMEPEVTDFYVENVHSQNRYLMLEDLASTSTLEKTFPADVLTITYLESGAEGTTPTTAAHWSIDLAAMDTLPIRMLANAETADVAIQAAGELYCKARENDNPIWMFVLPENQSKDQLITRGQNLQRGDDVIGVVVANWLKIVDPYTDSPLAPKRHIPNIGHVMGAWVRSIDINGIHYIPAVENIPLLSLSGVVGEQLKDDDDRTEVVDAGVNIIQEIQGSGIYIKNLFTPSTDTALRFGNALIMRNYFKVSIVNSLGGTENEPNSFDRIERSRIAMIGFGLKLWLEGSNGRVAPGETFGVSRNPSNITEPTTFEDHFSVKADLENNPQDRVDLGERNFLLYFSFPAPNTSTKVKVGILLR